MASGSVLPSSRVMSAATWSKLRSRISAALIEEVAAGRTGHGGPAREAPPARRSAAVCYIGGRAFHEQTDNFVGVGGIAVFKRGAGITHSPLM